MAGPIKGITIEFRGNVTPLQKALNTVRKETKGLDGELKQIDRALKFNPGNTTLLAQKQTVLKEKISKTKQSLNELKAAQAKLDDDPSVDKTSAEYRKLEREIVESESKLKHFERQLKQVGNVKLKAVGEALKSMGSKATAVGKSMSMYVTAPLVAAGTIGAKKFAEVDKTMQLTNSTMGNSAKQAEMLNKAMKSAAASSTFGMNDAATATLNFARAGLNAEQAASALAPAMSLAAGEGGELDTVSNGLVATINGFHGTFDQAAQYADVFANACNNSALDINSLSNAMSVAAPIFSSAGYSVNDAALYMGVMANNGIEADKAANSLKTGLARLVSPAKEGADMMEQLGISVTNSDGTMKDSVQIQKELHDAFGKLSESEQIAAASAIFGKNQMAPWLALINTAPGDVNKLNTALGETGTAAKMQEDMMKGFGGSMEKLKSGLDVLGTSFGEALAPMIMKVAEGIQKLVDWFNNLSPQAQRIVAIIAVVVAAIGPLLVIIGTLMTVIGNIMTMAPMIMGALAGVAGPIAIAIAVIAALIAIGILLYKNWDKIKAKALQVKEAIVTAWSGLKAKVASIFNAIKKAVTKALAAIVLAVFPAIAAGVLLYKNWDKIKAKAVAIKNKIVSTWNNLKSRMSSIFSSIRSAASSAWSKIKDAMVRPIESARNKVKGVIDKIRGFFPIKLSNIFSGFKTPHISVNYGSISALGKTVRFPKGFDVSWYAKAMNTGRILRNAEIFGMQGNRLLGGGEAGDELVIGANSASALIANAVAAGLQGMASEIAGAVGTAVALAGGGAQTIEIPIYLYKNGPQMGRHVVNTYDAWKKKLG